MYASLVSTLNRKVNKKVLIIGSGPAGMITAAYLLKAGIQVEIIEKSVFPRLVVGESLLPVSMDQYEELGLFEALNAAQFETKPGVRFIRKGKTFDFSFGNQHTQDAKTWAWQVPRADFDQVIANEIQQRGAIIQFGSDISAVRFEKQVELDYTKDGQEYTAKGDFLVDSSGFGCVLPKLLGHEVKREVYPNRAFFTHVKDEKALQYPDPRRIAFDILETELWFWVIPFSNGITSLGFAGNKKYFNDEVPADQWFREMMKKSEKFYDRFKDCEFLFEPKWHKGYSQTATTMYGDRYVLVGNTLEFLDPVFSSGVALATMSAKFASVQLIKELTGDKADWELFLSQIKQGIEVFRTYVETWYSGELQDIFFSDQFNEGFQRQICSVLAGYVWDEQNSFVKQHKRAVSALAKVVRLGEVQVA